MADAIGSQDFKFEIGNGDSPLTYTEVKEITSFNGFDGQAAEIDVTHLQSTAKEYLMGLQEFGTFGLECNYLSADEGQGLMRTAKSTREVQQFLCTFSDGSTAEFSGYVLSAPITASVDDKVAGSFTVRITGDVTFTEAP